MGDDIGSHNAAVGHILKQKGVWCLSIFELSPKEFTALSVLIGLALLPHLTADQQNAFGNFLMGIGQVLETASAQQAVVTPNGQTTETSTQLKQLEQRLAALEQHLKES